MLCNSMMGHMHKSIDSPLCPPGDMPAKHLRLLNSANFSLFLAISALIPFQISFGSLESTNCEPAWLVTHPNSWRYEAGANPKTKHRKTWARKKPKLRFKWLILQKSWRKWKKKPQFLSPFSSRTCCNEQSKKAPKYNPKSRNLDQKSPKIQLRGLLKVEPRSIWRLGLIILLQCFALFIEAQMGVLASSQTRRNFWAQLAALKTFLPLRNDDEEPSKEHATSQATRVEKPLKGSSSVISDNLCPIDEIEPTPTMVDETLKGSTISKPFEAGPLGTIVCVNIWRPRTATRVLSCGEDMPQFDHSWSTRLPICINFTQPKSDEACISDSYILLASFHYEHCVVVIRCILVCVICYLNTHEIAIFVPPYLLFAFDITLNECTMMVHDPYELNELFSLRWIKTFFILTPVEGLTFASIILTSTAGLKHRVCFLVSIVSYLNISVLWNKDFGVMNAPPFEIGGSLMTACNLVMIASQCSHLFNMMCYNTIRAFWYTSVVSRTRNVCASNDPNPVSTLLLQENPILLHHILKYDFGVMNAPPWFSRDGVHPPAPISR